MEMEPPQAKVKDVAFCAIYSRSAPNKGLFAILEGRAVGISVRDLVHVPDDLGPALRLDLKPAPKVVTVFALIHVNSKGTYFRFSKSSVPGSRLQRGSSVLVLALFVGFGARQCRHKIRCCCLANMSTVDGS